MKKVKIGDVVKIDGVVYRFGDTAALAFNVWVGLMADGTPEGQTKIHLYREDLKGGESFSPSQIQKALEQ